MDDWLCEIRMRTRETCEEYLVLWRVVNVAYQRRWLMGRSGQRALTRRADRLALYFTNWGVLCFKYGYISFYGQWVGWVILQEGGSCGVVGSFVVKCQVGVQRSVLTQRCDCYHAGMFRVFQAFGLRD
jgi:hypothetical protein